MHIDFNLELYKLISKSKVTGEAGDFGLANWYAISHNTVKISEEKQYNVYWAGGPKFVLN